MRLHPSGRLWRVEEPGRSIASAQQSSDAVKCMAFPLLRERPPSMSSLARDFPALLPAFAHSFFRVNLKPTTFMFCKSLRHRNDENNSNLYIVKF